MNHDESITLLPPPVTTHKRTNWTLTAIQSNRACRTNISANISKNIYRI